MENYFIVVVNDCDEVLPFVIKAKNIEEAYQVFDKACVCCDYDSPSYKLLTSDDVTLSKAKVISIDMYKWNWAFGLSYFSSIFTLSLMRKNSIC